jgi:hypothetical protein
MIIGVEEHRWMPDDVGQLEQRGGDAADIR